MQTEEALARLTQRVEEAERKTAIWRSQVIVLLLATVFGGGAALIWTRAHFVGRLEELAARARKLEKTAVEMPKVVEAERFVVRDSAGTARAEFGLAEGEHPGRNAMLSFSEGGVPRVQLSVGHLLLFRPDLNVGVVITASDMSSGIHVNGLAGTGTVFSASVSKNGYRLFSAQPIGSGGVFDFSAIRADRTD